MSKLLKLSALVCVLIAAGCAKQGPGNTSTITAASLRDVPSLRLNYRYEGDVPAPTEVKSGAQTEEKNPVVLADFDANRPQETLYMTVTSPNKQRILAVYQRVGDTPASYRLDMYSGDGKFLRRISPDTMAVDFPETIVWSPDSSNVAFVSIVRDQTGGLSALPPMPAANTNTAPKTDSNTNVNAAPADANTAVETPTPVQPMGEAPPNVLTFRTEQIYLCSSEGTDLKPITQNEGLIYYYFVWSPDGRALAALAASFQEWRYLQFQAEKRSELFVPLGRPRIVEKNGRVRILDDNLTAVHPVWSPDSAKVAVAFDKPAQIRIYDAIGDSPTQAAIPLRNHLLISSQAYDQMKQREEQAAGQSADANVNAQASPTPDAAQQPASALPDERTLVSFQPIIDLEWTAENILYFHTGFVKEFKTGEGARSSLRWHRLILSPQPVSLGK